jgi:hypothetical protein
LFICPNIIHFVSFLEYDFPFLGLRYAPHPTSLSN